MKRLEIVANKSVEDNLIELFDARGIGSRYTMIPVVHGRGGSGSRKGDHVWPEENFMLIIYCDEAEAEAMEEAVLEIKAAFPDEGIKCFVTGG